jgi:hypothetical protein
LPTSALKIAFVSITLATHLYFFDRDEYMAMYNRDAAVLDMLLRADSSGVNAVDGDGKTPIQQALTESPWGICITLLFFSR